MKKISFDNEICMQLSCLESFAYKLTKDLENANDLVQDTLIRAIRFHHQYQPGTNLRAWFFTIMRNTFMNNCRSGNRRNALIEATEEFTDQQLSISANTNRAEDSGSLA